MVTSESVSVHSIWKEGDVIPNVQGVAFVLLQGLSFVDAGIIHAQLVWKGIQVHISGGEGTIPKSQHNPVHSSQFAYACETNASH